jgi:3-phosphoglycerate kinase
MKKINEVELKEKNILIRCDYNVPISKGILSDEEDDRIEFSLDTIKEALNQEANFILLISHLGRPGGKFDEKYSLKSVRIRLQEYLGYLGVEVVLVDTPDKIAEVKASGAKIALLENIRFWPEEENSDEKFAKRIAGDFDVYVNNAFPVSHRDHSSISKFPKFCSEKCIGNLFAKEVENLEKVKENPEKPAVAVIGGAKIETKLAVIEKFAKNYDFVLVGGKTANEALDRKIDFPENVILPIDFSPTEKAGERLDIGEKTINIFVEKISQAKTVVWNGPMGLFEKEESALGTRSVISAIVKNERAFSLIGGGETISALNHFSSPRHFDYVSMSGGAMLDFLAGKELAGIKALQ